MADTKISALTSASALGGTEIFPGVQSAATVGVTATQIKTFVIGAGSVSIASGKTLTANNSITLAGTDSTTMTFPSSSATLAGLGIANVFTTLQTITVGAANTGVLASTGYSLTGSNATNMIDLAGTWNTTGTPTAIKLNITNTASDAASLLMDLQVGGSSKFKVSKNGEVTTGDNGVYIGNQAGSNAQAQQYDGSHYGSAAKLYWTTGVPLTTVDVRLGRAAAGILQLDGNVSGSTGAALQFREQTAPSAPSADFVRVYAEDNGSGKTRLMALFGSGAAQQIAIEP